MTYPDLHVHLYGSLTAEDLYYLHSRNTPRWNYFIDSYKNTYNKIPDTENLFKYKTNADQKNSKTLLDEYYYFLEPGDFQKFQTSFDLVIALSSTEPEELCEMVRRIASRTEGYSEFRMMFAPGISEIQYSEKVTAICETMSSENKFRPADSPLRLAMSLHRESGLYLKEYEILKSLQSRNESVRKELTGIDFCAKEEGFPPREKSDFVERVISDNKKYPDSSLAVLYHVGESYTDKTPESAARWVLESALMGCHRLGHAVALGIDPGYCRGPVSEIRKERVDHIRFLFDHCEELQAFGYPFDSDQLNAELKNLEKNNQNEISVMYGDEECAKVRIFQDWAMALIKEKGTVIEVCPTSNIRIANLKKITALPVWRFLERELKIVIGSDDPGILKTDILHEYSLIEEEIKKRNIPGLNFRNFRENAEKSVSEILSGRIR